MMQRIETLEQTKKEEKEKEERKVKMDRDVREWLAAEKRVRGEEASQK